MAVLVLAAPAGVSAAASVDANAALGSAASCAPTAPVLGISTAAVAVSSKSSAILGNTASSLDLIRLQQQAGASQRSVAAIVADASVFRPRLVPGIDASSVIEADCNSLAAARVTIPSEWGTGSLVSSDPEAFLASKRVRISRTPFDGDWKRVKADGISRSAVKRLVGAAPGTDAATLATVNRWVNHQIAYVEDRDLFGVADKWAGARRTLKMRKGDCEDIALLKMQMLAATGVPREDMILTIARDLVRQADHAVLIVRTADGYRMLDNASDEVVDAAPRQDYRAILSFGSKDTWLHGA